MKGTTNNPNGRPKGSLNKSSADLRQRISDFVSKKWDTIEADFDTLDSKERLVFFEKILQYALPKQRETKIDISTLTDAEVEQLLEQALKKVGHEN